jgi:hypothetical protein
LHARIGAAFADGMHSHAGAAPRVSA